MTTKTKSAENVMNNMKNMWYVHWTPMVNSSRAVPSDCFIYLTHNHDHS